MKFFECKQCGSLWALVAGDQFCPMCGARVPFVEIALPERPYLYADYPQRAEFKIQVRNVHSQSITIEAVKSEPNCFSMNAAGVTRLEPNQSAEITLAYSRTLIERLTDFPAGVQITVVCATGQNRHEDSLQITIYPKPTADADAAVIILPSGDVNTAVNKSIPLTLNKTTAERYESAVQDGVPGWFSLGNPAIDVAQGLLNLEIRPAKVEPGEYAAGSVKLRVQDHPDLTVGFWVLRAPLQFLDTSGFTVWTRQDTRLGLRFENVTDQEFLIESAGLHEVKRNGTVMSPRPDEVALEHEDLPLLITGKVKRHQGHDFRLRMNGFELSPGDYDVTVFFNVSGKSRDALYQGFRVEVREPEAFNGFVALDFGTCNSCAAYHNPATFRAEVLALLSSAMAITGTDETLVGSDARRYRGQWASSVKLEMGKDKPLLHNEPPRDLVYRLVRELFWRAEARAKKRFKKVILTYPSRFTSRQLNDFRYALMKLEQEFQIEQCLMIDEASAAAFSIVATMNDTQGMKDLPKRDGQKLMELTAREKFTLFVFDFGGGTIDMTFCEVEVHNKGTKIMRPLNAGGMRQLGGDDINRLILDMMAETFKEVIVEKHGVAKSSIWIPLSRDDLRENRYGLDVATLDDLATRISSWMEDIEKTKMDLLDKKSDMKRIIGLRAYLSKDRFEDWVGKEANISYSDFERRVRETLGVAVSTMKQIVSEAKGRKPDLGDPDLIVLAGGSSNISHVKEMIGMAFPDSLVRLADHLKECVALGASEYGLQEILVGGQRIIIEDFGEKTRSSFGYEIYSDGYAAFQAVVQKGEELPVLERPLHELRGTIEVGRSFRLMENFGSGTKLVQIRHDVEDIGEFEITPESVNGVNPAMFARSEVTLTVNTDESVELELVFGDKKIPFKTREMTTYRAACEKRREAALEFPMP